MQQIPTFLLLPPPILWDFAIALLLALSCSITIVTGTWICRNSSRHLSLRLLVGFLGGIGFLGFLTVTYGSFIEPQRITITERDILLPLKQPLRIVVLSDFHVGPYKGRRFLERAVDKTNALFPDVILLAGDFLYDDSSPLSALSPLTRLRATLGTFAVLGNHDTGHILSLLHTPERRDDRTIAITAVLEDMGISVLQNTSRTISLGAERLAIAGVMDLWAGTDSTQNALEGIPVRTTTILLSHNPDIALNPKSHQAHLIAAGHTHGGQIRLPWFGPLPRIPTRLGKKYDQGLFRIDDDTTLAITRGLGESFPRARLFAPPEILLLKSGVRLE